MTADIKGPSASLEVDFSDENSAIPPESGFNQFEEVVVHVPLPNFGSANSYIDLCSDLLDASWALEALGTYSDAIQSTVGNGYFKPNIRAVLRGLRPGLRAALADCALLFSQDESETDRLGEIQARICEYEDELHLRSPRLPGIVDWYFSNLMIANGELRSEAPDSYRHQMAMFPEHQLGFFRSAYSTALGADCYASNEGWLLPDSVHVDRFFEITDQKYRLGQFINGEILTLGSLPAAIAEELITDFPMQRLFRSQICAGFAACKGQEIYDTGPFDWLDTPFLPAFAEAGSLGSHHAAGMEEAIHNTQCLIHKTGTLIIINDRSFKHLIYDTAPLNLVAVKRLHERAAETTGKLAKAIGTAGSLTCNWASLSDEDFEQLCYDLIFVHPQYDSETIRKLGKSRSRDGGRDIEVLEIQRRPAGNRRKWIFQCKLIKTGASLGATKVLDVGDMLEQYAAQGFGVLTSAPIDATLYDKLDRICVRRKVEQRHMSVYELERALSRNPTIRDRYFSRR